MLLATMPPERPPGHGGGEMGGVRRGELDLLSAVGGPVADRRFTVAVTTGRADLRKIPAEISRGADR